MWCAAPAPVAAPPFPSHPHTTLSLPQTVPSGALDLTVDAAPGTRPLLCCNVGHCTVLRCTACGVAVLSLAGDPAAGPTRVDRGVRTADAPRARAMLRAARKVAVPRAATDDAVEVAAAGTGLRTCADHADLFSGCQGHRASLGDAGGAALTKANRATGRAPGFSLCEPGWRLPDTLTLQGRAPQRAAGKAAPTSGMPALRQELPAHEWCELACAVAR